MSVATSGDARANAGAAVGTPFRARTWAATNAIGLAAVYAIWALFAGTAEALGAGHESVTRDLVGLAGFFTGAAIFTYLRYRALAGRVAWSSATAIASGIGLSAGFIVGFLIAGPPIDFLLGTVTLGTVGSGLIWRRVRLAVDRPGRLLAAGMAGWLTAGIAAVVVAVLLGDAINDLIGGGIPAFVAVTFMLGFTGGAVGGAIEGHALASRVSRSH